MSIPAITIQKLAFHYPRSEGVCFENFNLEIQAGERFGLFGPNGAGKTTLIHLMTGLLKYREGSIRLLGHEISRHPKSINSLFGFVPQDFSYYPELSPRENLAFYGAWYGLDRKQIKTRTDELLEVLGLSDVGDRFLQSFSGGMKRRVNLAIGVMHRPKLLFLDEPTVGVDVQSRHNIIEYLKSQNKSGTTLVYTSHQMEEAAILCNKIALMDDGKIIAHDSPEALMQKHGYEDMEGLFLALTGKRFRD
ncbi:MAG TPA: ABC transporter ATP-binding protein [Chitinophagaceae bacterium]|nr:ABC transporter ATP-binding protein [Chitinophagaceae bacterium]